MRELHSLSTPVLHFEPSIDPFRYKQGSKRWLLWPFWAFKVLVEIPSPRQLNLLERFILKACKAGARSPLRLSEILALDQELVEFLTLQLQNAQLISNDLTLTDSGERLLERDEAHEPQLKAGYLFQDAVSGELWPRIITGALEFTDAELHRRQRATIQLGSLGRPRTLRPFTCWPLQKRQSPPNNPDEFAIIDACRKFSRELEHLQNISPDLFHSWDSPFAQTSFTPQIATLIDPQPLPYFLTTYGFLPEDISRSSIWHICDPFGFGLSQRLRLSIVNLIQKEPSHPIRELFIESIIGQTFQVDDEQLAEQMLTADAHARQDLQDRLGAPDHLPKIVVSRLVQLLTASRALRNEKITPEDEIRAIRSVLTAAFHALETASSETARAFISQSQSIDWLLKSLSPQADLNQRNLTPLAMDLGFSENPDLQNALLNTRALIKGVVSDGNHNLFAATSAMTLQASQRADHPLRTLGKTHPDLFTSLTKIKRLRDRSAHDTKHDLNPAIIAGRDELDDIEALTFEIIATLFPSPDELKALSPENLSKGWHQHTWNEELMLKLRTAANLEVQKRFQSAELAIRLTPGLKSHLIETTLFAREALAISAHLSDDDDQGALDRKLLQLSKTAANACEAALQQALSHLPNLSTEKIPEILKSEDRPTIRQYLADQLKRAGFSPPHQQLEAFNSLISIRPRRLRFALKQNQGALNALLWATLIRSNLYDRRFQKIARTTPRFVEDMAHIYWLRGHGDQNRLSQADLPTFQDKVFTQIELILTHL